VCVDQFLNGSDRVLPLPRFWGTSTKRNRRSSHGGPGGRTRVVLLALGDGLGLQVHCAPLLCTHSMPEVLHSRSGTSLGDLPPPPYHATPGHPGPLFFFAWNWGVSTQGFVVAKQALYKLSHTSSLFCSAYFWKWRWGGAQELFA
jgi:hypothetical protein